MKEANLINSDAESVNESNMDVPLAKPNADLDSSAFFSPWADDGFRSQDMMMQGDTERSIRISWSGSVHREKLRGLRVLFVV